MSTFAFLDWVYSDIVYDIGKTTDLKGTIRKDGSLDCDQLLQLALKELSKKLGKTRACRLSKIEKNTRKSLSYREKGNQLFTSSDQSFANFGMALTAYTECIAYAPLNSEEIAIGFANRSAVLLKLNRLEDCLLDINRALESKYPEKFRLKLHIRRGECYAKLARECYIDSKAWMKKVPQENCETLKGILQDYPELKKRNKFVDQECIIPELKSPSSKFPCASDALDVTYSHNFGRHIAATRDITVGEILVVEKPYFHFLDEDMRYTNCSHCMRFAWAAIPCDECVNAIFCSEKCKSAAWNAYHKEECTVHDLVRQYGSFLSGGQCTRLLIQMIKEAGGAEKFQERVNIFNTFHSSHQWHVSGSWFQKPCLESMLALSTNMEKSPKKLLRELTLSVLNTFFLIATNTDVLGIQYDCRELYDSDILLFMSKNQNIMFLGRILLRLNFVIGTNFVFSLEEQTEKPVVRGNLLMPFSSYFNHHCCPNTVRQSKRGHLVFYASFAIKRGEQVFTSVANINSQRMPCWKRQELLKRVYFFTCSCKPCQEDWPVLNLDHFAEYYKDFSKYWHGNNKMKKAISKFNKVYEKIRIGDLEDKDEMLCELYKIANLFYKRPYVSRGLFQVILESIRRVYSLTGNVSVLNLRFPLHDIITVSN